MTVFAMAGTKGGGGKSTLAVNLACELHRRGSKVLLIDTDPQQTSLTWSIMAERAETDIPAVSYIPSETIIAQVPKLGESYDHVVIDTAGRMDAGQRASLMVADVVVYPVAPSSLDLWALEQSLATLKEIQMMQEVSGAYVVKAAAVINRKQSGTVVAKQIEEALSETGLPVLGSVSQRVGFTEAFAAGTSIVGYAPGSSAAAEVRAVVDSLISYVSDEDAAQAVA